MLTIYWFWKAKVNKNKYFSISLQGSLVEKYIHMMQYCNCYMKVYAVYQVNTKVRISHFA